VRDVLAVFGLLGALAVFLLLVAFFLPFSRTSATPSASGKPTLQDANWLLYAAELEPNRATLELRDSGQQLPGDEDGVLVQAWCFEARRVPALDSHWREIEALDPLLSEAVARALSSASARASCVPAQAPAFAKVRLMRAEINDGFASSASVALYDADHSALYLVHAALLPPPAPELVVGPRPRAPSTE
jgi:hypothetical protein